MSEPHSNRPDSNGPHDGAPYRVMTVCTGNICRSPMAEVVLTDRFARAGLADVVVVDSTGISDEERGNPIDRRAARVLAAHGYPVPVHQARRARREDLAARDLVLAMTSSHARALRAMVPDAVGRVRMYRSFDPAAPDDGPEHRLDVDDPWYGDEAGFELTLAEVEAAADGVVAHVRAELAARRG
jgi:protein-tyrosine phosphatase